MSTREIVTISSQADRDKASRWAQKVSEGTIIEFRKKTRSHEQNAKLHAMLGEVSEQVVWYGKRLKVEDWKNMFTASLKKAQVVPGIDSGTVVPLGIHTSTLTIEEMSNLIELIYAFGAEHGVIFKDPKEQESGDLPLAGTADEPAVLNSSASTEEAAPSSSVDSHPDASDTEGGPASEISETADGQSRQVPTSAVSRDAETETLIQFAKDVLQLAAAQGTTRETLKAVEGEYSARMKALSDDGYQKARSISSSARAILEGNTSLESAVEFFSEQLGCRPDEIGADNG